MKANYQEYKVNGAFGFHGICARDEGPDLRSVCADGAQTGP